MTAEAEVRRRCGGGAAEVRRRCGGGVAEVRRLFINAVVSIISFLCVFLLLFCGQWVCG